MTSAYASLWCRCFDESFKEDSWAGGLVYAERPRLADVNREWSHGTPIRRPSDRHQAQLELDVLIALALDITVDELVSIYNTQFPVLRGYDRKDYLFDANGRVVPPSIRLRWVKAGQPCQPGTLDRESLTDLHPGSGEPYTYELPFALRDREHDLRVAYERLRKD